MSKSKATNYITIEGRLTRTPKVGDTRNGKKYCFADLAVRPYFAKGGKEQPNPDFFKIKAFGDEALVFEDMVQGNIVRVEGQMRSEKYKDKEGNEKQSWYVQVQPNGVIPVEARPKNSPVSDDEDGTYDPFGDE